MDWENLVFFLGARALKVSEAYRKVQDSWISSGEAAGGANASGASSCQTVDQLQGLLPEQLQASYRAARAGSSQLAIWLVGDAFSEAGCRDFLAALNAVIEAVESLHGDDIVHFQTVVLVPGPQVRSSHAADFLGALSQETRLNHFCWTVARGPLALTDEALDLQVARFLVLASNGVLARHLLTHGRLDTFPTRLATFGLSGVDGTGKERLHERVGAAVIESLELMLAPARSHPPCEDAEVPSIEGLIETICDGTEAPVLQRLRYEDRYVIPHEDYPDHLWSIYHFFSLGRATSVWRGIRERAATAWNDLSAGADRLVYSTLRGDTSASRVQQVLDDLAKNTESALASKPPKARVLDDIGAQMKAYLSACRRIPRVPAMLIFWTLFLGTVGYLVMKAEAPRIFPVLAEMDPGKAATTILLGWIVTTLFLTVGVYTWQLRSRVSRRASATETVLDAIARLQGLLAHKLAISILKSLQQYVADDKDPGTLRARANSYLGSLQTARHSLQKSGSSSGHPEPCFWPLVLDADWRDSDAGAIKFAQEWIRDGLQERLFGASAETIVNTLSRAYLERMHITETLAQHVTGLPQEELREIGSFVHANAAPLAFFSGRTEDISEDMFEFSSPSTPPGLTTALRLSRSATHADVESDHLFAYLRVFLGISPVQFDFGEKGRLS